MCLLTRQKEPIILKEDKVVWKILKNNLSTIFSYYQYELDKLTKAEIKFNENTGAYDNKQSNMYVKTILESKRVLKKGVVSIEEGLHSFYDKDYAIEEVNTSFYTGYYASLFECIIPAGSEYYEDETGLCVSNQLIVKHKIM